MSYRVLVVDDSGLVRSILKKALLRSSCDISEVIEAKDGAEALKILRKDWIDIVFTDINMPNKTGKELVEDIYNDEILKSIPIVVISSVRSKNLQEELRKKGVKKYIKKPFRPEQLATILKELLKEEWK